MTAVVRSACAGTVTTMNVGVTVNRPHGIVAATDGATPVLYVVSKSNVVHKINTTSGVCLSVNACRRIERAAHHVPL